MSKASEIDLLKNSLSIIEARITDQTTNTNAVLQELNELQRFICPKNLDKYLPILDSILDVLFAISDDRDVSIRHITSVILDSSVQVILPFHKSPILHYISQHSSIKYQPHALVSMIELSLKVTLFLTHSVILDLFSQLTFLLETCASHSSEIVAENFNRMAPQIRQFIEKPEIRLQLIRLLGEPKDSVLSARWAIKTAAIFAYPDIIEQSLPFIPQKMYFLASMPEIKILEIPLGATFEDLLPFIEQDPFHFTEYLQKPPEDHRQFAPFLLCLKNALPYGFKPEFDIKILTNISREPNISSLQYECIALGMLSEVINVDLREVFSEVTSSTISAYSICFNRFPSIEFLECVLDMDCESPVTAKSVVGFLCEIDFSKFKKFVKKSANKIAEIAKSSHDIVQKTLCDKCPHFNNGDVLPLYEKFLESADFFDANSFKNLCCVLSSMSCPRVDDLTNSFFATLTEIDGEIIWGDVTSLQSFLTSLKRFCMHSRFIRIPQYIASLPELVLYAIACFICAEPPHSLTKLSSNFQCQSGRCLASILSKQSQADLLELRDVAAACIGALKTQVVVDLVSLDVIGRKLLPWPSANNWLLLNNTSAKANVETTAGVLSCDPKVVFAAAQVSPEKLPKTCYNLSPDLMVLALEKGEKIDFTLNLSLIKAADRRKEFPSVIAERMKGSWMAVAIKKHFELECVKELYTKPFREWSGPPSFWSLVPYFVARLISRGVKIDFTGELPPPQKFITAKNVRIFRKIVKPCPIKNMAIKMPKKEEYNFSIDEEIDYFGPEVLRGLRNYLYQKVGCDKFEQLIYKPKIHISPSLIAMCHNELSRDASECSYDLICLNIELAAISDDVPKDDAKNLLKMTSFKSQWISLLKKKESWVPELLITPEFIDENVFTERELFYIKLYCLKNNINTFNLEPVTNEYRIYEASTIRFRDSLRAMLIPTFSQNNEQKMLHAINNFGVSKFELKALKKWCSKGDKPMSLLRFILASCLNGWTYFPHEFIDAIKSAIPDNDMCLQIRANILAAKDSPLKQVLEKLIPNSQ